MKRVQNHSQIEISSKNVQCSWNWQDHVMMCVDKGFNFQVASSSFNAIHTTHDSTVHVNVNETTYCIHRWLNTWIAHCFLSNGKCSIRIVPVQWMKHGTLDLILQTDYVVTFWVGCCCFRWLVLLLFVLVLCFVCIETKTIKQYPGSCWYINLRRIVDAMWIPNSAW